ncbi:UTP--glucose-1-phosphate uridylyltransferase GalU [Paenibacillus sp.]|uniref:UTP--glucose-1-phosphate uridylyltransferase GalU n=1 Tax=Paenibacillus sp. TaxID=58172 RepID=UPI002D6FB0B2|nr:UTP--glucose-1-phosphate uridylyltransferase GalU [Paenibacillus sp.]HZG86182.1 UTP--glucose-1-phosphate uridylyltransferase GalU [Paenibacillus sp.]
MRVTKAIIPAAGLGTRFLPATKAQPKEMLPLVDKPTIQYIVEEALRSGIQDIIIVTGRGKRAIEDHFDYSVELELALLKKGNTKVVNELRAITEMVNIHYIRQKEPKGLGHAIWCARKFIGNEPFAVLLGDDIVVSDTPCLKQLADVYEEYEGTVLGVKEVASSEASKYGIIAPDQRYSTDLYKVNSLVEKPKKEEAPSNIAIMGRYILTPDIFDILERLEPGAGDEIQLTDALNVLAKTRQVLAYRFEGERYDVGDKFGFVKATIDFALGREDLGTEVVNYLQEVLEKKLVKKV